MSDPYDSNIVIIRRDLDSITRVLDRFGKTKEGDVVKLKHHDRSGGYTLELTIPTIVNGLICDVVVEIDQYIVSELNDLDKADDKA